MKLAINLLQNADFTQKKLNNIKRKNLFSHLKMVEEIISFGIIETEKHKFRHYKSPIF